MRILNFIMFLFHKYYSKGGTKNIPYFSALCAVAFLIYTHIFELLITFRSVYILNLDSGSRVVKYGKFALLMLPVFLIIYFLVPPKKLNTLNYNDAMIKTGNRYLIAYIIANFLLLFLLIITIP